MAASAGSAAGTVSLAGRAGFGGVLAAQALARFWPVAEGGVLGCP